METFVTDNPASHNHIAIIGTGFGGIAAAVRLDRAGLDDFVLLERADDVGGVWRDNTYPGAAVDVQCQLYSYSFAPNTKWDSRFAKQPEILGYLKDVTQRFGLGGRIVLNCAVERLDWDLVRHCWRLQTAHGERTADHVVIATGALADPAIPSLIGLDRFAGESFHSARWDRNFDPAAKRVAVIGTGASAVQFIPAIAPDVTQLSVFQRTPAWVIPRHDRKITSRAQFLMRVLPVLQRLERLRLYLARERILIAFRHPAMLGQAQRSARKHLEAQVKDRSLRAKLLPDYRLGCKRVLVSDDYLAALDRPNVTMITDGIQEIDEDGIIDVTGVHHRVDAIIFGTGFRTSALPLTHQIYGRDGASMTEVWDGNPTAYLGTTVSGFPNCYLVHGPNIGVGHTSMIYMYESQANYIAGAISYARANNVVSVEPTPVAQSAFAAEVDRLSVGTVWTSGGCTSWYLDDNGRNINIWPGSTLGYRRRTLHFDASKHVLQRATAPAPAR